MATSDTIVISIIVVILIGLLGLLILLCCRQSMTADDSAGAHQSPNLMNTVEFVNSEEFMSSDFV